MYPLFASRPFAGERDIGLLIEFARRATAERWPRSTYWHAGDVVWQVFPYVGAAPAEDIRLWFDGEPLVGVVVFEPPLNFEFDVCGGGDAARRVAAVVPELSVRPASSACLHRRQTFGRFTGGHRDFHRFETRCLERLRGDPAVTGRDVAVGNDGTTPAHFQPRALGTQTGEQAATDEDPIAPFAQGDIYHAHGARIRFGRRLSKICLLVFFVQSCQRVAQTVKLRPCLCRERN